MIRLPKELTTVTRLSIILSGICFIFFVILAFYLGMQYQQLQDFSEEQLINIQSTAVTQEKPTVDETVDWKMYRFTDPTGFGYEIKVPKEWKNLQWASEGAPDFGPGELLQNFYDQDNCYRIYVHHFLSKNPAKNIGPAVGAKDIAYSVTTPEKLTIKAVLTGSTPQSQAFVPSSKGYYVINGTTYCPPPYNRKMFDQILSTFRFTK